MELKLSMLGGVFVLSTLLIVSMVSRNFLYTDILELSKKVLDSMFMRFITSGASRFKMNKKYNISWPVDAANAG